MNLGEKYSGSASRDSLALVNDCQNALLLKVEAAIPRLTETAKWALPLMSDEKFRQQCCQRGGIVSLTRLLSTHCLDEESREAAVATLDLLSGLCPEPIGALSPGRDIIIKQDGVTLVLEVLRKHIESMAVLFSGFRVLRCIANGAVGRAAVLKAGCIEIILASLENCIDGRDMVSLRLQQAGYSVLRACASEVAILGSSAVLPRIMSLIESSARAMGRTQQATDALSAATVALSSNLARVYEDKLALRAASAAASLEAVELMNALMEALNKSQSAQPHSAEEEQQAASRRAVNTTKVLSALLERCLKVAEWENASSKQTVGGQTAGGPRRLSVMSDEDPDQEIWDRAEEQPGGEASESAESGAQGEGGEGEGPKRPFLPRVQSIMALAPSEAATAQTFIDENARVAAITLQGLNTTFRMVEMGLMARSLALPEWRSALLQNLVRRSIDDELLSLARRRWRSAIEITVAALRKRSREAEAAAAAAAAAAEGKQAAAKSSFSMGAGASAPPSGSRQPDAAAAHEPNAKVKKRWTDAKNDSLATKVPIPSELLIRAVATFARHTNTVSACFTAIESFLTGDAAAVAAELEQRRRARYAPRRSEAGKSGNQRRASTKLVSIAQVVLAAKNPALAEQKRKQEELRLLKRDATAQAAASLEELPLAYLLAERGLPAACCRVLAASKSPKLLGPLCLVLARMLAPWPGVPGAAGDPRLGGLDRALRGLPSWLRHCPLVTQCLSAERAGSGAHQQPGALGRREAGVSGQEPSALAAVAAAYTDGGDEARKSDLEDEEGPPVALFKVVAYGALVASIRRVGALGHGMAAMTAKEPATVAAGLTLLAALALVAPAAVTDEAGEKQQLFWRVVSAARRRELESSARVATDAMRVMDVLLPSELRRAVEKAAEEAPVDKALTGKLLSDAEKALAARKRALVSRVTETAVKFAAEALLRHVDLAPAQPSEAPQESAEEHKDLELQAAAMALLIAVLGRDWPADLKPLAQAAAHDVLALGAYKVAMEAVAVGEAAPAHTVSKEMKQAATHAATLLHVEMEGSSKDRHDKMSNAGPYNDVAMLDRRRATGKIDEYGIPVLEDPLFVVKAAAAVHVESVVAAAWGPQRLSIGGMERQQEPKEDQRDPWLGAGRVQRRSSVAGLPGLRGEPQPPPSPPPQQQQRREATAEHGSPLRLRRNTISGGMGAAAAAATERQRRQTGDADGQGPCGAALRRLCKTLAVELSETEYAPPLRLGPAPPDTGLADDGLDVALPTTAYAQRLKTEAAQAQAAALVESRNELGLARWREQLLLLGQDSGASQAAYGHEHEAAAAAPSPYKQQQALPAAMRPKRRSQGVDVVAPLMGHSGRAFCKQDFVPLGRAPRSDGAARMSSYTSS